MQHYLDPYILPFYQLTGLPSLDGIIGTFALSLMVVVIGEFTISLVFLVNRGHLDKLNRKLKDFSDLSQKALQAGDQISYKALNRQANDAYGHVFFNQFGLSAAALWPAFFALDWMQSHFMETGVAVPVYPFRANYVLVFLCCYILARIVFGRLKRHLPYFRSQYRMLQSYGNEGPAPREEPLPRNPAA